LSRAQLVAALEVSPADLLGIETKATRKCGKPGLTPQLQLRFERIQRLPRKDQEFIIRFWTRFWKKLKRNEKSGRKQRGRYSLKVDNTH
jgi:hypothetical protein